MFNNNHNKNNSSLPPYTVADLLNGHNLDIIGAVLLVTGKLKVNTVKNIPRRTYGGSSPYRRL
ncbi:hypothetical protein SAMN05216352_105299 [Alteribacillus bidgolensis]|uniref:Uncharacterized protein n=1 Tax=Alteribacillus bidgolensis TaxID=930129 RepID=A0A1G8IQT0_9BACI|nr:hypothetical protein SAMN05216352_105299 [Alteribacillus bidgolensis]